MRAFIPALLVVIASCDASVRLGSLATDAPVVVPDAAAPARDAAAPFEDAATTTDGGASPADASSPDAGALRTLATEMPGVEWLAVDDDHITWTTSGRTGTAADPNGHFVANKDGTNRIQIQSEPGIMRGVAIAGPDFYSLRFLTPASLIERSSATQALGPLLTSTFHEGFGIAADDTYVYAAATTRIARIERTAEAGVATLLLASFVKAVAVVNDGDQLYVADQSDQRVARVEKSTGSVPWSQPVGGAINDVAVDATQVYFAGGDRAGTVSKTGSNLNAFDLPGATALAVDATGIYYATATAVLHASTATPASTTVLASGFTALGRIALDADAIYFTDKGAGAIYRLAK